MMKIPAHIRWFIRTIVATYFSMTWKIRHLTRSIQEDSAIDYAWQYDRDRFIKHGHIQVINTSPPGHTTMKKFSREHVRAMLIKNYHTIEKAMALKCPHHGFGQESGLILKCITDCKTYLRTFGSDSVTRTTFDVLREYRDLYGKGYAPVEQFLADHANEDDQKKTGGTKSFDRQQLPIGTGKNFFTTRHSIRHYGIENVPKEKIIAAVDWSQYGTPSVCNRQPGKVYVFTTSQQKKKILELQNGNRGFGDSADYILIVTSDLRCFMNVGERNQCWISGGMLAMSVIYALHAQGIATCSLNWDVTPEKDEELHALTNIPASEVIIMMIAVGSYPDHINIACSERLPLDSMLHFEQNDDR